MKKKKQKQIRITPVDALELLYKQFGSWNAVARAFKVSMTTVGKWRKQGMISYKRAMQGRELSNYKISLHEFRPDIYPE